MVISGVFVVKGLLSWTMIKRLLVNGTNYEKIKSQEHENENLEGDCVEMGTGHITRPKMNG